MIKVWAICLYSRGMDTQKRSVIFSRNRMADKTVKFCRKCQKNSTCDECDKTFAKKRRLESTAYHQVKKDITVYLTKKSKQMIVDLGCPTSVLGKEDLDIFIANLTEWQKNNLEMVEVDEKFRFGPSGPYGCSERIRFPIKIGSRNVYCEVAIVHASIPMLLGNNILKPLGAKIELFPTGNGILKLGETVIGLTETSGRHYTIQVGDLGKLSYSKDDCVLQAFTTSECEMCDESFKTEGNLRRHKESEHSQIGLRSILKNPIPKKALAKEASVEEIVNDLNTQLNRSNSETARMMIQTMKKIVQMKSRNDDSVQCDMCHNRFPNESRLNNHKSSEHGQEESSNCELCGKVFGKDRELVVHKQIKHGVQIENCVPCGKDIETGQGLLGHEQIDHEMDKEFKVLFLSHHSSQNDLEIESK